MRGKEIGFVFQTFNLISSLTAIQNVELPMIFQNVKKEERKLRAKKLLSEVGLSHRANHLPSEMSGGERQRRAPTLFNRIRNNRSNWGHSRNYFGHWHGKSD